METCRTCAKCDFEDDWLDLFHSTRYAPQIKRIHAELINWRLQVTANDGLPQKICTECFAKFCNVDELRATCQAAQAKLSNIFDRIDDDDDGGDDDEDGDRDGDGDGDNAEEVNDDAASNENGEWCATEADGADGQGRRRARRAPRVATPFGKKAPLALKEAATQTFPHMVSIVYSNKIQNNNNSLATANATTTATTTRSTAIRVRTRRSPPEAETEVERLWPGTRTAPLPVESQQMQDQLQVDDLIEEVDEDVVSPEGGVPQEQGEAENGNGVESPEQEQELDNTDELSNDEENIFGLNFQCKYCYRPRDTPIQKFPSQKELFDHIYATHDADQPFNCPHCERAFLDGASRTIHIKEHHVQKNYNCEVCGKRYADRFNLRHHVEKYHSDTDFECRVCEKRFYSRKSLNYHNKWHDEAAQLKCSRCDRIFISQRHLKYHEETHTGIRSSQECPVCGKSFIHLKTLRWHLYRQHGGEKPVKCGSCKEVFASYMEKRIHMLDHHLCNLTSMERTECMICHERYDNEVELKAHMKAAHSAVLEQESRSSRPTGIAIVVTPNNKRVLQNKQQKRCNGLFQCEMCDQRFNMKSALERHAAVHSEGRPHGCPQCSKRFKRPQDRNWHMKTHAVEKTNVCDVCGKAFALKYVLNQHRRSHDVLEKNFTCTVCGRSYLFEKSLRLHERTHSGKTFYRCDVCGDNFVTHIKLKYHMKKQHEPAKN